MKRVLYFSAPWCGPCRMFKPVIESLKSEGISVTAIDVDSDKLTVDKYGVRSVPTTIILNTDGSVHMRLTGAKSKQELINACK